MKKRLVLVTHVFSVAAVMLLACTAPTPELVKEVVTRVVEGTPQVVERPEVTLKVSVAEYADALPDSQQFLQEAMTRVAADLGEEHGMDIEIDIAVQTLPGSIAINCEGLTAQPIPEMDLYLLDSPSALHAFLNHGLDPVPEDVLESVAPFEPSVQAFTHPDGRVLGLAQATGSLLVIYNPEELELPEQLSWEETFEKASQYGMRVPSHSCIAIAAFQSAIGDGLTEDLIFLGGYRDLVPLGEPIVDGLSSLPPPLSGDIEEILADFVDGEVPFVIHSTGFLTKLAEVDRDGSVTVATTRFPSLDYQGGAAHSVGWVVPAGSENAELAWALAEKLTHDPAMLQWGLANGMVPANQEGFDMLTEDPSLVDGLLPEGLFHDSGWTGLLNSTAESTIWRIPPYVPMKDYNDIFLPGGNMMVAAVANDRITLEEATELVEIVRSKLELRFDPQVFFDLGNTYYKTADYNRAIVDFDQAILLDSQYAEAYCGRGMAYAELGKREEAISDLEMALELGLDPGLEQETEKLLEELKQ